ncbi:hypothetical protein QBC33DRAFT_590598, partial [Phialemonium atrogriseum]
DPLESKPPKNLKDTAERLAKTGATPSAPESACKRYANKVGYATNEATIVFQAVRKLLKEYVTDDGADDGYQKVFNQAFAGFPKDLGFNNGLSAPQPDFIEGLRMEKYRPFPVDEHVSGAVLYKDDHHSLTLPHMAGEWKGRGEDMEETRLQRAYYGCALVYTRNQALSYIREPDRANHAEIMTFTTDGTNINFFAHYAIPSEEEEGKMEYHQYPIASMNLTNSYEEFKKGRKQIRNLQDHGRGSRML